MMSEMASRRSGAVSRERPTSIAAPQSGQDLGSIGLENRGVSGTAPGTATALQNEQRNTATSASKYPWSSLAIFCELA
ncbi:hypothetical protein WJX73_000967 [Symbiochloris irregularis]|uniref:Uncharacterized protein n=1 Tax=Symbiochloris irregularis TaxID=706552 RepID=A0AAW1NWN2_9CHLO